MTDPRELVKSSGGPKESQEDKKPHEIARAMIDCEPYAEGAPCDLLLQAERGMALARHALRSTPTGETEPPIGYVRVTDMGRVDGEHIGYQVDERLFHTFESAMGDDDVWGLRSAYPIGASAGGQDTALREVEAIGRALLVDWAEHLTPAAPGSIDDKPCPWDKLSEGSRERYLQRAFKILTALREVTSGASAGSGEPDFTQRDMDLLRGMAALYDDDGDNFEVTGSVAVWATSLADRIEESLATPPDGENES